LINASAFDRQCACRTTADTILADRPKEVFMAKNFIDTILLIALPASGKSEVRRYLMHEERDQRIDTFHISDTVQLDDYPYVEFFREVDDALIELGQPGRFYKGARAGFQTGADWGVLLQLVNEDYDVITDPSKPTPAADADLLFDRIDRARRLLDAPVVFAPMNSSLRLALAAKMQRKTEWLVHELFGNRPDSMENKTLVIEFARGGPDGASMPLSPPHGYGWNLAQLRPEILERAGVLYIWVSPEESRRKNKARDIPGEENTILFHSAPESVMIGDYGCDDIEHLMEISEEPNTIAIDAHGKRYHLPIGRFDNRVDLTTFVRDEPETWDPQLVTKLRNGVLSALGDLWAAYQARK